MRLVISRKADLATRSLLELVTAGDRLKGAALAERVDASPGFLAQAMTPLVSAGWVRSDPGPSGGYTLVAEPSTLSVLEVIEAVEGPTDTARCVLQERACNRGGPCALHHAWSGARDGLLRDLGRTSLADLLAATEVRRR